MPEPVRDNFDRGDRAFRALRAAGYAEPVLQDYNVADLIADLCHTAQRNGFDVGTVVGNGVSHYGSDCIEQAWANDDGWDNMLQAPENVARAHDILVACNVPELFHEDALRKCGLLPPIIEETDDA